MTAVSVLGICGSTRKASINRALLVTVGECLPAGTVFSLYESLETLPIFNSDHQDPQSVLALKGAIAKADGVIISTPEYNYSIPGGLKNALDWVSRPPATSPLRGKPVGLVGAASGMSGTIRAQNHLRQMLVYSDSPCMNQPEVLIPRAQDRFVDGKLTDESTRQLLARFGTAFVTFIRRHTT
ncbi:MAG TPA: NADPH-dependent FMN reductase [Kofleriaceae bacterium]|nr:NADPH-dependent FMN reductase [Kofleriaceae bacterium]